MLPLSTLHIHALLPTSSNRLFWHAADAFSLHPLSKHISYQHFLSPCNVKECQCGHFMPRSRVSHHCSCRPSHLLPLLNLSNLSHPIFLLVTSFSCPYSICPVLSGLTFNLSPTAWASQVLAGTMPTRDNFLTLQLHVVLLEGSIILYELESQPALLPSLLFFFGCFQLLTLVLKSTPSVSTLSARVTPSSLLN